MTSPFHCVRRYTRSTLLQHRASVTTSPSAKVKRRLWFWGILRGRPARSDDHVISSTSNHEDQDSQPAQLEPRGSAPRSQLTPRIAPAKENIEGRRHLPHKLSIATFNARTLRDDWRIRELVHLAFDLDISILGLQEHRRSTLDPIQLPHGWQLKLAPASPSGSGGIGFLLSPTATSALLDLVFLSERVGAATFCLKDRRLHVICAYAPTSPRTLQDPLETESFYDILGTALDSIPARDLFYVVGDFNAPLQPDGRLVKNRCGSPNANSDYLQCFISARDLITVNGFFRQRRSKLPTFFGPNMRTTRLDWIFCPFYQKSRARKIQNIRPCCVCSDHSLVVCESDLRWQSVKRTPSSPRPLWEALKDRTTKVTFIRKLRGSLSEDSLSADAFSEAVLSAARALPKRRSDQPKAPLANDPEVVQARQLVQKASARYGHGSDQAKAARDDLKLTHARRAEELTSEAVLSIQLATDNCRHSAAWRAIDALTGRKRRPHAIVSANSVEHRKSLLASHYHQVLNAPTPTSDLLPINNFTPAQEDEFATGPITVAEVAAASRTMRPDAAPGVDIISPRVFKLTELAPTITLLLNSHCSLGGDDSASAATQWRVSKLISIPKKGNATGLDNQRGIALQCAAVKLLNAILRNRLLPALNRLLLPLQSGFRPGRSAVEQIATLRSILDDCRTRQRHISIVFVDFRKAFDSVSRAAISWVLELYGVPNLLVSAVMDLYRDSKAIVQTCDGPTQEFSTSSGVLQGDTLAPLLFIVLMDYVLRRSLQEEDSYLLSPRRSPRHPAVPLPALAYADDVALLCRDPTAAQRVLNRLCEEGDRVGLQVNGAKTEALHIGFPDARTLLLPNGEHVPVCRDFKYLGNRLMLPDSIIADRRAQAWRASHLLRNIFNSAARDDTKIRLFRAAVEPILLYGTEALPMTETRERALDASYRALLRFALGIHYPQRITNQALMERGKIPALSSTLRQRRQRLLGHSLRSYGRGNKVPLALTILHRPSERLRRGQARTVTATSTFAEDLAKLGMSPAETVLCPSPLFSQRVRARL